MEKGYWVVKDECGAWEDCKQIIRDELERETACRGCGEVHPSTEYCPKMFAKKEEWEAAARTESMKTVIQSLAVKPGEMLVVQIDPGRLSYTCLAKYFDQMKTTVREALNASGLKDAKALICVKGEAKFSVISSIRRNRDRIREWKKHSSKKDSQS